MKRGENSIKVHLIVDSIWDGKKSYETLRGQIFFPPKVDRKVGDCVADQTEWVVRNLITPEVATEGYILIESHSRIPRSEDSESNKIDGCVCKCHWCVRSGCKQCCGGGGDDDAGDDLWQSTAVAGFDPWLFHLVQ